MNLSTDGRLRDAKLNGGLREAGKPRGRFEHRQSRQGRKLATNALHLQSPQLLNITFHYVKTANLCG